MEYCDRGSLSDILADELVTVPWATRWAISRDIAIGLNFMHDHLFLHRYERNDFNGNRANGFKGI